MQIRLTLRSVVVFVFLMLIACVSGAAIAASQTYLRYLPDVPLMPSMVELDDQSMIFDKAEGRVIESSVLAGDLSEIMVREFYQKALPELGWVEAGPQRFLRNEEQLIVKWEKLPGGVPGGVVVRFSLSPKQGQSPEKNF